MNTMLALASVSMCSCLVAGAALAGEPMKPAELRTKALEVIKPLPDRMPGSEKDTQARVELGQKLYFDKRLSVNDTISCNSCHPVDQKRGGADNEPTSPGAHGKRGDRNSPTSLNAGFHLAQFWDGRAADLKAQAKGPVLNSVEMAMPSEEEVVKKLSAIPDYVAKFAWAFPESGKKITYDDMAEAIAAFERTLVTHDRFDDFLKGDDQALNATEKKGLELFLTVGCTTCHSTPTMGGSSYMKVGLVHPYATEDVGREKVTKDEDDRFKFKVPSLRNIAMTGPYFHNGKGADLKEAVKTMAYIQLDKQLTAEETDALVAFLGSLTDKARAK
jgi:cytochrome c peroxidase